MKRTLLKIIALVTVISLFAVALTGCGAEKDDKDDTDPTTYKSSNQSEQEDTEAGSTEYGQETAVSYEKATEADEEPIETEADNAVFDESDDTADSIDWSDAYYHLIVDNNNSIGTDDGSEITVISDTPLALHDFDMNGIPELIIGKIGARLGLEVFTIYDGDVVYAGGIGGKSTFYSDNKAYHGIFRGDSWSEYQVLGYTGLSDGKLEYSEVITGEFDQSTKTFDYTIEDNTLYDVYFECTAADNDDVSVARTPKNELQYYYWCDVESDGWNSFVEYFGY